MITIFTRKIIFMLKAANCSVLLPAPTQNTTTVEANQTKQKLKQNRHILSMQANSWKFTTVGQLHAGTEPPITSSHQSDWRSPLWIHIRLKTPLDSTCQGLIPVADVYTKSSSRCYVHSPSTVTAAAMLCCSSRCGQPRTSTRKLQMYSIVHHPI